MKKILTNKERLESLKKRSNLIKESFQREYDKIKRLDEETSYQGLDELDYNDVYSKINPNDKQRMKIDDYPAEGKNLEYWLSVADTALNSSDWEEKKHARHRFLMDDDKDVQEYYDKLVKIKSSLDKANNGEPLDDFEKKIVRYYKTDKAGQNHRIHRMAQDKIASDYTKNYDGTVSGDKTLNVIDWDTKEPVNVEIVGNSTVKNDNRDISIHYPVSINGESGILKVYEDGSHGFTLDSGKFNNLKFKERPDFIYADAKKLRNVYPDKKR